MAVKLTFTLEDSAGAPESGLVVQVKNKNTSAVVASTAGATLTDNGDGSYTTVSAIDNAVYSVYTGAGAGTLVDGLENICHVDPDDAPGAIVPVASGGTGVATAELARTALGLEIGSDVQAYGAYLAGWNSAIVSWLGLDNYRLCFNTSGSFIFAAGATARGYLGLTIGTHVQAYSSYLSAWATYMDGIETGGGGTQFLCYDTGAWTAYEASDFRDEMGLGTAALEDVGVNGVPAIASSTTRPTAGSGNYGSFFFDTDADSGAGILYFCTRGASGIGYQWQQVTP